MRYRALLFDLDDTILSFKKAEDYAITKLLNDYSIETSDENKKIYSVINTNYWKKFERNEIQKDELLIKRFFDFFNLMEKNIDYKKAKEINEKYFMYLSSVVYEIPGAINLLQELKKNYKIYIITNGVKSVQEKRLNLIPELKQIVDKIYISEDIGYVKPQKEFIDYVIKDLNLKKDEILIIGDSLSSDMQLGINNNIDTCWLNNNNEKTILPITYIISNIKEIRTILK